MLEPALIIKTPEEKKHLFSILRLQWVNSLAITTDYTYLNKPSDCYIEVLSIYCICLSITNYCLISERNGLPQYELLLCCFHVIDLEV